MSVKSGVQEWKETLLRLVEKLAEESYDLAMTKCEAANEYASYMVDSSDRDAAEEAVRKHIEKLDVNYGQDIVIKK